MSSTFLPTPALPIIIVGAGPSGLFAAEILAQAGHEVHLYEAMASAGRKFLMAGRGGLNLTHSEAMARFKGRYGDKEDWVGPWLERFGPDDLRSWAEGLGQPVFVGSSGRVFPHSLKASPLLRAWLARLRSLGVNLFTSTRWVGFSPDGAALFQTQGGTIIQHRASAVLLALGGASWPKLGSDGIWAGLLAQHGVGITPMEAANTGVLIDWSEPVLARFCGAVVKNVAIKIDQSQGRGDIVITRYGLEGGPLYAVTQALQAALKKGPAVIMIDLRPDMTHEALAQRLAKARTGHSLSTKLKSALSLSPAAISLIREATANQLPANALALAQLVKAVPLTITERAGLARAISTAGGIKEDSVNGSLMLNALPGVFVAGEMLDWDAPTGGYLLQACFASAVQAAKGIMDWLQSHHPTR